MTLIIMKPLNTKTLTSKEREYQEMCSYMEREVRLGADLRWFITFQFQDPDDKCRADNKIESTSEKVTKYKSLTKLSYLNETSYDGWMRDRYSDLDWIYRDTNAINRRLHWDLFGIRNLKKAINNPRYNRPNVYYFHEKGKYGKYRNDKIYHTHLLLPDIPRLKGTRDWGWSDGEYYSLDELKYYFNYKPSFRCLKSISLSRDFYIEDLKSKSGSMRYLTKETSNIHLSLDPFNSYTIQRKE